MGISVDGIERVSRAQMFADFGHDGRQRLVYAMDLETAQEAAIILPLPVARGAGKDALRFVDPSEYPEFFDDLAGVPERNGTTGANDGTTGSKVGTEVGSYLEEPLPIHRVGDFEASYVPSLDDWDRLDPRFRLDPTLWEQLGGYDDLGFAVFRLSPDRQPAGPRAHSIALEFVSSTPDDLFFPTVRIHNGQMHRDGAFDRDLYTQQPERHRLFESLGQGERLLSRGKASALVDENIAANRDGHRYGTSDEALARALARVDTWRTFLGEGGDEPAWDRFLAADNPTDRGAYGLFSPGFRSQLDGARVLEFGAGRGLISAAMALMGAEVVAVDISASTSEIVGWLAQELDLGGRLRGRSGDVRAFAGSLGRFDYVVGVNVLHHLVPDLEAEVVGILASMLRPDGAAIFVEPCENWRWLVELKERLVPDREAGHPERENSSAHFVELGRRIFEDVEVAPYGSLERWAALVPGGRRNAGLRAGLLRAERAVPAFLQAGLAPSQRIEFRRPLANATFGRLER